MHVSARSPRVKSVKKCLRILGFLPLIVAMVVVLPSPVLAEETVSDPFERFNRKVQRFNDVGDKRSESAG